MFAFVFDSVSGGEWLVLLAVILIIVGPKNLPSAARKAGEIMAKLRRAADEFKRQLMTMDDEMKKTADDLRKEYIDIPEDDTDRAVTDADGSSDDPYGLDPDSPDYPGDYPEGYPEEDYYGMDDSGPVMEENPAETSSADASAPEQSASAASAGDTPAAATPETPEKSNG